MARPNRPNKKVLTKAEVQAQARAATVSGEYATVDDTTAADNEEIRRRIANETANRNKAERERKRKEREERQRQRLAELARKRAEAQAARNQQRAAAIEAKMETLVEKINPQAKQGEHYGIDPQDRALQRAIARGERDAALPPTEAEKQTTRSKKKNQRQVEQQRFQEVVNGSITSTEYDYIPGMDDMILAAFGKDYDSASAKMSSRFGYTKFYDENGSSIDPRTGKPYDSADYNAAIDRGEVWKLDPETLEGPLFRKRGKNTGQPLAPLDQQALATGAIYGGEFEPSMFTTADSDQAVTQLDWIREIAGWATRDKAKLVDFQQRMYDAGYYESVSEDAKYTPDLDGTGSDLMPQFGVLDTDTLQALSNFTDDASALGFALNMDIDEFLAYKTAGYQAQLAEARARAAGDGGGGGGGGAGPTAIPVTDETVVRQLGDTIGQEVFGRRLTATESQLVTDLVRRLEIEEGQLREVGGPVEAVDPEAQIRKALRERDPATAQAHDVAGAFEMFASILGAGLGVGQGGFGQSNVGPAGGAGVMSSPTTGSGM